MYSNSSSGPLHHRLLMHEVGSLSSDDEKRSCQKHSVGAGYQSMSRRTNDTSRCLSDISACFNETFFCFHVLCINSLT